MGLPSQVLDLPSGLAGRAPFVQARLRDSALRQHVFAECGIARLAHGQRDRARATGKPPRPGQCRARLELQVQMATDDIKLYT
eukprot:4241968-Heterocapsa_arctica.AAC.1